MSANSSSILLLCAHVLLASGGMGCVETEVDPADDSGGMSNAGGTSGMGGSTNPGGMGGTGGMGGSGGGTGGSGGETPAPAGAIFKCEDPTAPKVAAAADNQLIVDFETGSFTPAADTGEGARDLMFVGSGNGGTYTYQEPGTQIMRNASLVADRSGGQAFGVVFTNATAYGGGLGVYFYPCVDARAYTGITFWARGSLPERVADGATVPAGTVTVSLDTGEVATNSLDTIGCAMNVPADMTLCTRAATTFVVSDTWAQFTFAWADFAPGNSNGTPYNPNGDNLLGINLAMDNNFGMPNDLELMIDDVAFVP